MKWLILLLPLLAVCFTQTAEAFTLDNQTVIEPSTLGITFKIADYWNITTSLTIDTEGIRLNDYWLKAYSNESANITVFNYSELSRHFEIANTTTPTYFELNLSGLNQSTNAEIYADLVLVDNVSTNSSGWLNYVFVNMSADNTTDVVINQTINHTATAAVTPTPTTPTGGGGGPSPQPDINCSFNLFPEKLIGTGKPGFEIDPKFTMYIQNLLMNQTFTVFLGNGIDCYIDYSNFPNRGVAVPGEIITYRIGCMTPETTKNSTVFVVTDFGCSGNISMEVKPTSGFSDDIEIAFKKFGFGDYTGFLDSKISGMPMAIILLILGFLILILLIILTVATIGGR